MKKIKIDPQIPLCDPFEMDFGKDDFFVVIKQEIIKRYQKRVQAELICAAYKTKVLLESDRMNFLFALSQTPEIQVYNIGDAVGLLQQRKSQNQNEDFPVELAQTLQFPKNESDQELSKMKRDFEELKQQKAAQESKLSSRLQETERLLEQKSKEVDNLNQELKEQMDQRLAHDEESQRNFLEKMRGLNQEINALRQKQFNDEKERDDLHYRIKELENEVKSERRQMEQMQSRMKNQASGAGSLSFEDMCKLEQLQKQITQQELEESQLKSKIERLQQLLKDQNTKYSNLQMDFKNQKDDLEIKNENLRDQLESAQTTIKSLEHKIKQLVESNDQQRMEIASLKNQQEVEKVSAKLKDDKLNELNQKLKDKMQDNTNLTDEIKKLKQEKDKVLTNLDDRELQLKEEINKMRLQEDRFQKEIKKQVNEIQSLNQVIEMKDANINQLKNEVQQWKTRLNKQQEQLEVAMGEHQKDVQKERDKFNVTQKRLQNMVNKLKILNPKRIQDGKILSPIQNLYSNQSFEQITQFEQGGNIMTDEKEFNVKLITFQDDKIYDELTKNGSLEITKFLQLKDIGKWKVIRSINSNADGTKKQLFLFKVKQGAEASLIDRIFGYMEGQGIETDSPDRAIYVAINTLVAKYLMEVYKKKLKGCCDVKIPDIKFQDQYLIEFDGKFCVAEQLIPGQFVKYNGEQSTAEKDSKTPLLNAFSLFTYKLCKEQFMITNLQGVDNILYDPVISTEDGCHNDEDLGQHEIYKMLDKYKANPKEYGKSYIQALSIKI